MHKQVMQRTKHNPKVRLHEAPPKKYYGIFRFGQYVHHAILYIFSLPSLRMSRFMEDVKQATAKLSFRFSELGYGS